MIAPSVARGAAQFHPQSHIARRRFLGLTLRALTVAGLIAASAATNASAQSARWAPADLGTLGGGSTDRSHAASINNLGDIVGWSDVGTPVTRHAFLWNAADGMRDLGTLGGATSSARYINDTRQVVGSSTTTTGETHAFLWTAAGGMVDLGTLGGATSEAVAVNNLGQVVGTSTRSGGERRPFLWSQSTGMVDLGGAIGPASMPTDINDSGVVIGDREPAEPFAWTAARGLVTITGALTAAAINARGEVTGRGLVIERGARGYMPYIWTEAGGIRVFPSSQLEAAEDPKGGVDIADFGLVLFQSQNFGAAAYAGSAYLAELPEAPIYSTLVTSFAQRGVAGSSRGKATYWCRPEVPLITGAAANPNTITPVDGRLVTVRIDYTVSPPQCGATTVDVAIVASAAVAVIDDHTVTLRAVGSELDDLVHTILIRATDDRGTLLEVPVYVTVPQTALTVDLTPSVPSPQPTGSTITWTTRAGGRLVPEDYRFSIRTRATGVLNIVQDWSAASTFDWRPTAEGLYDVIVQVRRGGVSASASSEYEVRRGSSGGPVTSVTLTPSLPSPQLAGSSIT